MYISFYLATEEQVYDKIFTEEIGQEEQNKLRKKLHSSFESIQVSIFPERNSKRFDTCVTKLKRTILRQMSQPRTFGNTIVDFQNFDSLVRDLAKKVEKDGVVHPISAVRQYQREEIDKEKRNFIEYLKMAYDGIILPVTDGLEEMLIPIKNEQLEMFKQRTATIDLETEHGDKVFEELKDFADREITVKKRENQLVTENSELREKGMLTYNT